MIPSSAAPYPHFESPISCESANKALLFLVKSTFPETQRLVSYFTFCKRALLYARKHTSSFSTIPMHSKLNSVASAFFEGKTLTHKRPLGKGRFGSVTLCTLGTEELFALKKMPAKAIVEGKEKDRLPYIDCEFAMTLGASNAEKSIQPILLWYSESEQAGYILMDFAGVPLEKWIPPILPNIYRNVLQSVLEAYRDLQELNIFHNDPHPGNICINPLGKATIIDFTHARYGRAPYVDRIPTYASYENIKKKRETPQSATWSIGLFLFILIVKDVPWDKKSLEEKFSGVLSLEKLQVWVTTQLNTTIARKNPPSRELLLFIRDNMLIVDETTRKTPGELLSDPLFLSDEEVSASASAASSAPEA